MKRVTLQFDLEKAVKLVLDKVIEEQERQNSAAPDLF